MTWKLPYPSILKELLLHIPDLCSLVSPSKFARWSNLTFHEKQNCSPKLKWKGHQIWNNLTTKFMNIWEISVRKHAVGSLRLSPGGSWWPGEPGKTKEWHLSSNHFLRSYMCVILYSLLYTERKLFSHWNLLSCHLSLVIFRENKSGFCL